MLYVNNLIFIKFLINYLFYIIYFKLYKKIKYMKIKIMIMINYIKNILFRKNENKIVPSGDEDRIENQKLDKIIYKIKNITLLEDDELEYLLSLEKEDLKKIIVTYDKSFDSVIKIINSIYIH